MPCKLCASRSASLIRIIEAPARAENRLWALGPADPPRPEGSDPGQPGPAQDTERPSKVPVDGLAPGGATPPGELAQRRTERKRPGPVGLRPPMGPPPGSLPPVRLLNLGARRAAPTRHAGGGAGAAAGVGTWAGADPVAMGRPPKPFPLPPDSPPHAPVGVTTRIPHPPPGR